MAAYCSRFTSRPEEEPGTLLDDCGVEIEMSGNWSVLFAFLTCRALLRPTSRLIRWTASDSDLPFAFLRAYFRQLLGYLPKGGESISLSNMLKMPGFLFVAASFLDKCDSLVHRSLRSVTTLGPSSNNFNAGESANLAMGAKPKVLELAHRRLVSTALEIVGGSPRLPEDPEPIQPDAAARRHYFGPLLVVWVRAITKRTSMWDTRSVFLLLDFLDGLFYTLLYTVPFGLADDDDCPPRLDPTGLPLFDLPFIRDVLKRILTSADNTVCVMRTIAFVYSQFEAYVTACAWLALAHIVCLQTDISTGRLRRAMRRSPTRAGRLRALVPALELRRPRLLPAPARLAPQPARHHRAGSSQQVPGSRQDPPALQYSPRRSPGTT